MSESECQHANWRDVGLRDGLNGQPLSLLDDRIRDCRKAGVVVDTSHYVSGREQGLRSFCRMENAIPLGLQGTNYEGVCPPLVDGEFRRRHQLGYAVYSLRAEINTIDNRSETLQRQLREADRDEQKALHDADTDDERRQTRKRFDDRRHHLRADLRELDRKLHYKRDELRSVESILDGFR